MLYAFNTAKFVNMQVQIKYIYINPCIDDTTNEFINVNFYICGDSDPATAAAVADLTKN